MTIINMYMVILPVEVGGDKDRICCISAVSIVLYLLRLEAIPGVITNQVVNLRLE